LFFDGRSSRIEATGFPVIKKTLKAREQKRKDIAESRKKGFEFQKALPAERLVFLDESCAKTHMTRFRGRSLGGARCPASAPFGHWKTRTMLLSLRRDGTTECLVVDGAVDKAMFSAYIAQIRCPSLRPNDLVSMDNLSAHKNPDVARHIQKRGADLLYLPAYSPDLNPIEKMWSKVKQLIRGREARTYDALEQAIAQALDLVSASDATSWFKSCGYGLAQS
jgi:transposase